ncbi:MAG: type II toxin-antitoxin system VapC family toxin [Sulfuricella sp.]
MITAVDTSVLLDIFFDDPAFSASSAADLRKCIAEGALIACDIVWAETASAFPDKKEFLEKMSVLGISFSPMSGESSILAGQAWKQFRLNGGKRDRVIADFLIGAHAMKQGERLLTRDRGFYRGYFANLVIFDSTDGK